MQKINWFLAFGIFYVLVLFLKVGTHDLSILCGGILSAIIPFILGFLAGRHNQALAGDERGGGSVPGKLDSSLPRPSRS